MDASPARRALSFLFPAFLLLLTSGVSYADTILQNDGYTSGANVGFQGGFVTGEIGASRFLLPGSNPVQLKSVILLLGGASTQVTITLHVWDDSSLGNDPGSELYSGDYQLIGSDNNLQQIDLSGQSIFVSAPFRVGIEFQYDGYPSIARDGDGTITSNLNYIDASGYGWVQSSLFGITGDWIIRAVVADVLSPGPVLSSIEDVGNDQGGQVRLDFQASSADSPSAPQPVLSYEAYRRIDPLPAAASEESSSKLGGWEYVGAIPAHAETSYNMIVPTLADSTIAQGMHYSVFFVRAATALPSVFYDSVPDSGYSVDNLAPSAPNNLVLNLAQLDWDASDDADFDYFRVYGSPSGVLDGSQVLLGATSLNAYSVSSNSDPYYLVTTVDFAGNESPAAAVANPATGVSSLPSRSIWVRVSPNPFNPATSIRFFLPQAAPVSLMVYDQRGRLVDTLFRAKNFSAGEHSVPYRSTLPSGVYLVKLISNQQVKSVKISLVR